jgi:hypothetical protein
MSRERTRWEKADISYRNYIAYLNRKSSPCELSLIDLLYVSNFKGGSASIQEQAHSIALVTGAWLLW